VSGEIDGLTDNATSAATAVFIDSAPAAFGLTTPFSVPLPPFGGNNEFTVVNGVITIYAFVSGVVQPSPALSLTTSTGTLGTFNHGLLIETSCGPTVQFCSTGGDLLSSSVATPLPAALPLFASGLGALGLLGWRRKRKSAAIAA